VRARSANARFSCTPARGGLPRRPAVPCRPRGVATPSPRPRAPLANTATGPRASDMPYRPTISRTMQVACKRSVSDPQEKLPEFEALRRRARRGRRHLVEQFALQHDVQAFAARLRTWRRSARPPRRRATPSRAAWPRERGRPRARAALVERDDPLLRGFGRPDREGLAEDPVDFGGRHRVRSLPQRFARERAAEAARWSPENGPRARRRRTLPSSATMRSRSASGRSSAYRRR